jgi:Xaa-Pro aminopeptidase
MNIVTRALLLLLLLVCSPAAALAHMGIEASEFQARRLAVMSAAPDGIVLLHSFSARKGWDQSGFQQDSNFYYLTGLENLHGAILAVDGATKECWLFVKLPTESQKRRSVPLTEWDAIYLTPDHQSEQTFGIDHVVAWDGFADFITSHLKANPGLALYVDQGGVGKAFADVSDPPDMAAVENPYILWPAAIKTKWPDAKIANAAPILNNIRAVKSAAEIALIERAEEFTDAGMRAAFAAVAPGRTNRQVEGAAIEAGLRAGADGISMWPELRSGPLPGGAIYQKANDYHGGNRALQAGETMLMDLGFSHEFYKGDIGRTIPVSGHFTANQREVVNLMSAAYLRSLQAIHDGVSADAVIHAGIQYVEDHRQGLMSELARRAAEQMMQPASWIMYTHGLDMVEIYPVKELHTGNTVAFGPDFQVDGMGFYEEDVSLVTAEGYKIINPAWPYTAADIEKLMARLKHSHR